MNYHILWPGRAGNARILESDLSKLITKHVAVLAKTGAGKSYTVGVLLEEILEHGVPLLIIDPHGEYSSLRKKNLDEKDRIKLSMFGLELFSMQYFLLLVEAMLSIISSGCQGY